LTETSGERANITGKSLTCEVESIFPFGVFVRLPNGMRGYIRRRELTLSGDKDPRNVVTVGQELQAIPIGTNDSEKTLELSVRSALPNPWPEFARYHQVRDVVTATVKHLYAEGVWVEIVPGVDGYIPSNELTMTHPMPRPEDILWPGDHIEATIIVLDPLRKRLILSMRRRLEQMMIAEAVREQLDWAGQELSVERNFEEATEADSFFDREPLKLGGPVLVVEDRDDIREPLLAWLQEQGCKVEGAASAEAAIELCKSRNFVIGIFDLDIPGVNGVTLIQRLRQLQNEMPIAVMSGPDMIMDQWPKLQPLGIAACLPKPLDLDELMQTLRQIGRGEAPQLALELTEPGVEDEVAAFQSLATNIRGKRQFVDRLKATLDRLVRETNVDKGIIFHLDSVSNSASIIAEAGQQRVNRRAIYRLPDSPVKDVIRESAFFIKGEVSRDHVGRLQNLLPLLTFESFVGIPLEAGGRTEHALFLFARRPKAFPQQIIRQALSTAFLMQALLESQILEQRLETASGILLSGQLSSAFGHEAYNKVSSLDLQMRLLLGDLDRLDEQALGSRLLDGLHQVKQSAVETSQTVADLRRTVEDFQRLMRTTDEQHVDVKHALESAKVQVNLIALRKNARIYLHDIPDLPMAQGNSIRLQQVFLNLMLNAVQQMDGLDPRRRILRVSAHLLTDEVGSCIQVRFTDKGPGIHCQLWEKIFALGFTTREGGSGLGLFIARSLVESMGGSISVEESLILIETTFLIDLPIAV
jgi:signal transduction histidine kinase/DNA-binding response OmpR family regulator/predicted RNA-binding protein with RPS1 domain